MDNKEFKKYAASLLEVVDKDTVPSGMAKKISDIELDKKELKPRISKSGVPSFSYSAKSTLMLREPNKFSQDAMLYAMAMAEDQLFSPVKKIHVMHAREYMKAESTPGAAGQKAMACIKRKYFASKKDDGIAEGHV